MIRVLLFAPANEILGGQAVQARRLMALLGQVPGVEMRFQAINPLFPAPLRWVKRIPLVRTALTMLLYVPQVLLRARHADILHIFTAGLNSYTLWTIPALLIGKLYGCKLIINYRDGQVEQHLREFRSAKVTLSWGDVIVAPIGYIVDVLARNGIESRCIPNVIDPGKFMDRQRSRLRPVLMTNRILEPLYNIECILRAFGRVLERYPEAALTIAHTGPSGPGLRRYAETLGLRNYRFVGQIAHEDMPRLYDEAEIYITTPDIDCMPGSILESLASGLPVIATRTGGIPYLVRDEETALLVECNDDRAVADRVFRLLEDSDLVERLTEAGRRELVKYAPETIREAWIEVYQELVKR